MESRESSSAVGMEDKGEVGESSDCRVVRDEEGGGEVEDPPCFQGSTKFPRDGACSISVGAV
jgi:hypothetical protein